MRILTKPDKQTCERRLGTVCGSRTEAMKKAEQKTMQKRSETEAMQSGVWTKADDIQRVTCF